MGDVVQLNTVTSLDSDADTLIASAIGKLERVFIIGYTETGEEYFASSIADGGTVLWLMERMKQKLLNTEIS
jgi:hypothetical protein